MRGYLRLELRRTLRTPGFLIFTVAMPLVMYLVFTNIGAISGPSTKKAAIYTMISVGGFGAIGALLNYGAAVVSDRTSGWLRQLRLVPLSPASVVLGKGITGVLLALPPVASLCVAAVLINQISLTVTQWLTLIPLMWLGSAPFVLLGLGVGYLCSAQAIQPANFISYFGLSLLGGLWLPLRTFPTWLQHVGKLTPTHAYADLSWRVVEFSDNPLSTDVLVMAGWCATFAVFAAWAYRRSATRRDA